MRLYQKILYLNEMIMQWGLSMVAHRSDQHSSGDFSSDACSLYLQALAQKPDYIACRWQRLPPLTNIPGKPIVKGDSPLSDDCGRLHHCQRDAGSLMGEYHEKWPDYGFNAHKGYGTKQHLLRDPKIWTLSPIHRMSFEPLKSR